ncbi:MAG: roadblock/LC7 domain-containing protein [Armatimonadota bacterium]
MQKVLEALTRIPGVRGSLLVAADGIIIGSHLPQGVSDDEVAALVATIARTTEESLRRIERGPLRHAEIDAERGKIFLQDADKGILVLLSEPEVNVGLIRLEMKAAADKLQRLVGGGEPVPAQVAQER